MQTPGTALIVVLLSDGSRLVFEHPTTEPCWFPAAMAAAGARIAAAAAPAVGMVLVEPNGFMQYSAGDVAELTGGL